MCNEGHKYPVDLAKESGSHEITRILEGSVSGRGKYGCGQLVGVVCVCTSGREGIYIYIIIYYMYMYNQLPTYY